MIQPISNKPDLRLCVDCQSKLPLTEFDISRRHKDKLWWSIRCKACQSKASAERYRQSHTDDRPHVGTREWRSTPQAQRTATPPDLAWAAGFLEGEGCFSANTSGGIDVTAAQVNREPLERLVALFGGRIRVKQQQLYNPKAQPCCYWGISGSRAAGAMMTLFLFLSEKRKCQIRSALLPWIAKGPASPGRRSCR